MTKNLREQSKMKTSVEKYVGSLGPALITKYSCCIYLKLHRCLGMLVEYVSIIFRAFRLQEHIESICSF